MFAFLQPQATLTERETQRSLRYMDWGGMSGRRHEEPGNRWFDGRLRAGPGSQQPGGGNNRGAAFHHPGDAAAPPSSWWKCSGAAKPWGGPPLR